LQNKKRPRRVTRPFYLTPTSLQPLPLALVFECEFIFILELPMTRFAFGGVIFVAFDGIRGGVVELLFIR